MDEDAVHMCVRHIRTRHVTPMCSYRFLRNVPLRKGYVADCNFGCTASDPPQRRGKGCIVVDCSRKGSLEVPPAGCVSITLIEIPWGLFTFVGLQEDLDWITDLRSEWFETKVLRTLPSERDL